MGYKAHWRKGLVLLVVGLLIFGASLAGVATSWDGTAVWDGQGSDSLHCEKLYEGGTDGDGNYYRPETGWMHWIFNQASGVTEAVLFLGGSGSGSYNPTKYGSVVEFFTPYFDVETIEATVYYNGTWNGVFTLSDYCPGEEEATLKVSVNLEYDWTVDWDWDIEKTVDVDKWELFVGDTGTSTYTITVTKGEEVEYTALYGNFCVENVSTSVVAQSVVVTLDLYEDDTLLDGEQQVFHLGDIPVGEEECRLFSFDIDLVEDAEYKVEMTVTLYNGGPYDECASVTAVPDIQGLDAVTLTDSWYGPISGTFGDGDFYSYYRTFDCASHEEDDDAIGEDDFWRFPNTAEIVELEDKYDDAYVDVYCYELEIDKTAVTTFDREHEWDIDKYVETENGYTVDEDTPKIWLFIDGSYDETATWNVCVTYLGYEDREWVVSGEIRIHNPAPMAAVINSVTDVLSAAGFADIDADIDFGDIEFPYTLAAGETLDLDYSADLTDGYGRLNTAIATQQNFDYSYDDGIIVAVASGTKEYEATAAVTFGDPENELYDVINIKDVSDYDFFDTQDFGPLYAASYNEDDEICFDYNYVFAYGEYDGPSVINNTATIVETEQSASAILKINTQKFLYESAWAKGEGSEREEAVDAGKVVPFCGYFANWGWTNQIRPGTYNWDLWAGAAQCDTSKGTLVGWVEVTYAADGSVTVTYELFKGYVLEEYHVYAGTTMFPQQRRGRRTVNTVAPGQYYNAGPFNGSEIYVIAHAVVGYPDPDFGPE